jgi:hypothetical protein
VVVTSAINAANGMQTAGSAPCGSGKSVLGGGYTIQTTSSAVNAIGNEPADGADVDALRDDVWRVTINNQSGGTVTFDVYAICAATG